MRYIDTVSVCVRISVAKWRLFCTPFAVTTLHMMSFACPDVGVVTHTVTAAANIPFDTIRLETDHSHPINMTNTLVTNKPTLCIALPVAGGRLHGHFGGCREFALIEADRETKTVRARRIVTAPPHQPGLFPLWLREQGVRVVIVGGIGQRALDIFTHYGIEVCAGSAGASVETQVAAYLSGQLNTSPTGCEHHGHSHEHEHEHEHEHGQHHHHDPAQPASR